jgi:hypothetical protein
MDVEIEDRREERDCGGSLVDNGAEFFRGASSTAIVMVSTEPVGRTEQKT